MGDTRTDKRATMVFVMHNHQPAGNFEHVFRESFDRAYRPTVELLWQYEAIHASLHYTGPLLEWIEANEPSFLDLLKKMVDRGQIEILGGGFFEPIFCWLRPEDQRRQVDLMRRHLRERFGQGEGEGFWLAERVWETDLPARLASLGLSCAPLDDHHFHLAGISDDRLHGYYTVSWEGHPLKIFPISKDLRYLIPFRPPDVLLSFLDRQARGGKILTYADDGEKFGVWPATYKWVWEEGYLEHLFSQLNAQSGWLRVASMGEIARECPPTGIAVLPNASYTEMMEWALPAKVGHTYHQWVEKWEREGGNEDLRTLFRGGIFENFLVKYPDVHRLYHRMLLTGHFIAEAYPGTTPPDAVLLPYLRAQGNDVYWHGLFGGLYLSNLRHEAYRSLLESERALEEAGKLPVPTMLSGDFDADGSEDHFVRTRCYNLWITPGRGASVLELDDRTTSFHLTNTLTRQEESYHIRFREEVARRSQQGQAGGNSDGIPSIHDMAPTTGTEELAGMVYDRRPRRAFSEGVSQEGAPVADLLGGGSVFLLDLGEVPARLEKAGNDSLRFSLEGTLEGLPLRLIKEYRFLADSFSVGYRLESPGTSTFPDPWKGKRLWVEIPLTLLAGHDSGRTLSVDGRPGSSFWDETGDDGEVTGYQGEDTWSKTAFRVLLSGSDRFVHGPIETVSLSEAGLEKTFQGSLFMQGFSLDRLFGEGGSITVVCGPDARSLVHA
uniref:4-alpha-glucanotransferase n=1 Tax=Leptospirillum ferrodiazotrophum TaxID=412449 RepID=C6HZA5_9BACT|nr:MAG: 4-alpha-glucanotransferase [Leptospirillum ferrodiazotrophum]